MFILQKQAKFLPNEAVSNDEMEDYLGLINEYRIQSQKINFKK